MNWTCIQYVLGIKVQGLVFDELGHRTEVVLYQEAM